MSYAGWTIYNSGGLRSVVVGRNVSELITRFRVRPQVNVAFEEIANLELGLRLSLEDVMEDGVRDETNGFFFGQLVHVPNSSGVYRALSTTASGFDASDDTDFASVHGDASLGYAFQNSWLITVSGGREWFEERDILNSRFVVSEAEDNMWEVGVQWQPNELTTFNAGYGQRVFGNYPFMSLRRFTRNNVSLQPTTGFTLIKLRVIVRP